MSDAEIKPLNWNADSDIGYSVERRPDGGMQYTFKDVTHETLEHWRRFSMDHLIESDRLTRNLYDLRQIDELPEEAIIYALEGLPGNISGLFQCACVQLFEQRY